MVVGYTTLWKTIGTYRHSSFIGDERKRYMVHLISLYGLDASILFRDQICSYKYVYIIIVVHIGKSPFNLVLSLSLLLIVTTCVDT